MDSKTKERICKENLEKKVSKWLQRLKLFAGSTRGRYRATVDGRHPDCQRLAAWADFQQEAIETLKGKKIKLR